MPATMLFRSSTLGASTCLRLKASSWRVRVAACHEQVVEVVRDAARELADRIHLLGLPQLILARAQGLVGALELGQVDGEAAELPRVSRRVGHDVNDVAQPDDLAGGRQRPVLELVVLTAGERRAALGHHLGPVLRVDALAEEVRLVEPAVGREPEDRLGALAHEGEAEGRGVRLPHDGVESLHQVLESLLGFLARRLQALLLGQVLDDEQQPRLLLLFDADARDRDPHPARLLPVEDLELEREVVLRRA